MKSSQYQSPIQPGGAQISERFCGWDVISLNLIDGLDDKWQE